MKFVVWICFVLAILTMPQLSTAVTTTTGKYRVAWKSSLTGTQGHGSWQEKEAAFLEAERANYDCPALKHYVQQKLHLGFITLPSKLIALIGGFQNTDGMKNGDIVRYHLSEWELGRSKVGKIQGTYGTILFVDGKVMGVNCILEHLSK